MLPGKEARGGIVTGSYAGCLAPVFVTGSFPGCLAPVFVTGSFAGCLAPVFVATLIPNTWEITDCTSSEQVSKTSAGACVGTVTRKIFLWHILSLYIESKNKQSPTYIVLCFYCFRQPCCQPLLGPSDLKSPHPSGSDHWSCHLGHHLEQRKMN